MKIYEIQRFGYDGLKLSEAAKPIAGPGQVLVRMHAASLNFRDVAVMHGRYNPKLKMPMSPLSDGAGVVEAVGEGVTTFASGERVIGTFFQGWTDGRIDKKASWTALGGGISGVLSEYIVFEEDGLVKTPAHLTDVEASTLPCAALTAWHALFEEGPHFAGDVALVLGTGGVSLFALQFAKQAGLKVIVTSSSDEKLERARKLGADETINYKTTPDWEEAARKLTGGAGVDHVIEVGGSDTLPRSLRAVRMGGTVSVIGVLSGAGDTVGPRAILMNSLRVQGIYVGSRAMFERMNRAIEAGKLKPVVDQVFPFEDAAEAYRYMESQKHFGKICISIP
jgi:NADPH:quinone reductase-like Zn-dependent oxidoreductase